MLVSAEPVIKNLNNGIDRWFHHKKSVEQESN